VAGVGVTFNGGNQHAPGLVKGINNGVFKGNINANFLAGHVLDTKILH
jgi:hypothetical protein